MQVLLIGHKVDPSIDRITVRPNDCCKQDDVPEWADYCPHCGAKLYIDNLRDVIGQERDGWKYGIYPDIPVYTKKIGHTTLRAVMTGDNELYLGSVLYKDESVPLDVLTDEVEDLRNVLYGMGFNYPIRIYFLRPVKWADPDPCDCDDW